MTARFSSASSAGASPVVPSATMPGDAGVEILAAEPLDRLDVDRADASNGVIERDPDAAEIEVARHATKAYVGTRRSRSDDSARRVPSPPCRSCCSSSSPSPSAFVTGVLSGMFGIGGAVISTPAIRALGATTFQAIGSTLPSILPSSISGSLRYNREDLIRGRDRADRPSAFGVPASVVGSRLSDAVPGNGPLADDRDRRCSSASPRTAPRSRSCAPTARPARSPSCATSGGCSRVIGIAAGALSGLLGVGGGILMVPAFSAWVGLPLKETIATSLACVGIFAIPGTITHALLGDIDWAFAIPLAIGVIPGAQVGAHFTIAADDRTLRYTVGDRARRSSRSIYAVGELVALVS